ncbi:MAG: kinase [Psychromonas sp.]
MFRSFINRHQLNDEFIDSAQSHFVPLANSIIQQYQKRNTKKPFFVAINGSQGSGKSTLAAFIGDYIEHKSALTVIVLSLDDFYLSRNQREELASNIHPLFITRGVPGTHNTEHIQQVFNRLLENNGSLPLPHFNKATDNPDPTEQWKNQKLPVDIVIFEGWCWGVQAQTKQALSTPINDLEEQFDKDAVWRTYINNILLENYHPLYAQMDFWVQLKAPSFACVYQWRLEQEKKLRSSTQDKDRSGIMSESQILNFIAHYQRLTEHCLATLADSCDVVFHLNNDRKIDKTIFKKGHENE